MSTWTVPTPVRRLGKGSGPQLPEAKSPSSGESIFEEEYDNEFSRWGQSETHDIIVGLALALSECKQVGHPV